MNIAMITGTILAVIVFLMITFAVIIIIRNEIKESNKPPENNKDYTEEIKILLNTDNIMDKINMILYEKIKQAADIYMIFNVKFNGEDAYLPQDTIDEMSKYIFGTVKGNMTPAMRELIGLVYDIDTDERLDNLLDINIKMYMLNEIVKTNKDIVD